MAAAVTAAATTDSERATRTGRIAVQRAGVRLADFDADGRDDLFLVEPQSGSWFGALGGRGDFSYVPGQWSVAGEPIAVDLNGDGAQRPVRLRREHRRVAAGDEPARRPVRHVPRAPGGPGTASPPGTSTAMAVTKSSALSAETGAWFQALPDGRGAFTYRSGTGLHDGDVRVADFDADSRDDVFVYDSVHRPVDVDAQRRRRPHIRARKLGRRVGRDRRASE